MFTIYQKMVQDFATSLAHPQYFRISEASYFAKTNIHPIILRI